MTNDEDCFTVLELNHCHLHYSFSRAYWIFLHATIHLPPTLYTIASARITPNLFLPPSDSSQREYIFASVLFIDLSLCWKFIFIRCPSLPEEHSSPLRLSGSILFNWNLPEVAMTETWHELRWRQLKLTKLLLVIGGAARVKA